MNRIVALLILVGCFSCKNDPKNTKLSGAIFGTTYHITYDSEINFETQFDSLFSVINKSMSTYQPDSDISKLNRNEDTYVDEHFIKVFKASENIYKETDGVFDPTIGDVVNAWDFGPEGRIVNLDSLKIDSLMLSVGFDRIKRAGNTIIKEDPNAFIDFNAIAKGYGVDVIGEFLERKGIHNYLVEIGG